MDQAESAEVCRLCLKAEEYSKPLVDEHKNMLQDILPDLNITSFTNCYICKACSEQLLQSYKFKRWSLQVNSPDRLAKNGEISTIKTPSALTVKHEATSQSCCLCHGEEAGESLISNDFVSKILPHCLPELGGNGLKSEPAVCYDCFHSLEAMFAFINACLEVEERIKIYSTTEGLTDDSYINLRDVAFKGEDKEIIKEEMELSLNDVKVEPTMEIRQENDESDVIHTGGLDLDSSSMDFYEQALLLALLCRRRKNRKKRRFWVGPWGAERLKKGMFYNLYKDLRKDGAKFSQYFGISTTSFDELLSLVKDDISGKDTMMRQCVPPDEKLALTLRYLSTGSSMVSLHREFRLGVSTISIIIHAVCKSICKLRNRYIPTPDEQCWLDISGKFEKDYNFPNCIGAIGGKKLRMINSKQVGYPVLLAVCDSEYRFTHVEVNTSDDDSWKDSILQKKLTTNSLNVPKPKRLEGCNVPMPFVFIGNSTFGVLPHLLRPYNKRNLCLRRKVFNYRLSRARRQIDCTFGILSNKWKIFQRRFDVSIDFAEAIAKSCCILHNFVLDKEGYDFEHTLSIEGLWDMDPCSKHGGRIANKIREDFTTYFLSEAGQVPWQMSRI